MSIVDVMNNQAPDMNISNNDMIKELKIENDKLKERIILIEKRLGIKTPTDIIKEKNLKEIIQHENNYKKEFGHE